MATRASTSAPTPVELMVYHVGDQRIMEMGVLEGLLPEGLLPEATQGGISADASLQGGTLGFGLYFALSEGSEILDVAYLSPLLPPQNVEEVEGDDSPTEEEEDGVEKSSEEEEVVEANDCSTEEEEEAGEEEAEEEEDGVVNSSEDEATEDEEEAEEEEGAEEEEEGMDGSEEEKILEDHKSCLSMQARITIDSSHAIFVLFDEGLWKLTKAYSIKWLRSGEEQPMLKLINKEKNHQATSNWLKGCTSNLDFEGCLFHSNDLEDTIKKEMSLMINNFTLTKKIGKGGTSEVYQCFLKKPPMLEYAVKIIKAKSTYDLDAYEQREPREIQIMSSFDDSSALKFYQAWHGTKSYLDVEAFDQEESTDEYSTDEDDDSEFDVCILMEISYRTLKDCLAVGEHSVGIEEGWILFEKIAKAVSSMHQKGVIHRDIKPQNIFIGNNEEIKLGDFGDSCWVNSYMGGRIGTPDRGTFLYMAPELGRGKVSNKVDIYSLGVIFLEIFHPFKTEIERYKSLMDLKENIYPTAWVGDSILLKMLIALNPIDRASISDVLDYLSKSKPNGYARSGLQENGSACKREL